MVIPSGAILMWLCFSCIGFILHCLVAASSLLFYPLPFANLSNLPYVHFFFLTSCCYSLWLGTLLCTSSGSQSLAVSTEMTPVLPRILSKPRNCFGHMTGQCVFLSCFWHETENSLGRTCLWHLVTMCAWHRVDRGLWAGGVMGHSDNNILKAILLLFLESK